MWLRWLRCKWCINHQCDTVLTNLQQTTTKNACFYGLWSLILHLSGDMFDFYFYFEASRAKCAQRWCLRLPRSTIKRASKCTDRSMATAFAIIVADLVGLDFTNMIIVSSLVYTKEEYTFDLIITCTRKYFVQDQMITLKQNLQLNFNLFFLYSSKYLKRQIQSTCFFFFFDKGNVI